MRKLTKQQCSLVPYPIISFKAILCSLDLKDFANIHLENGFLRIVMLPTQQMLNHSISYSNSTYCVKRKISLLGWETHPA